MEFDQLSKKGFLPEGTNDGGDGWCNRKGGGGGGGGGGGAAGEA